jgi:hypothetical protein
MPSIDSSFQQIIASFSKRLTKQELEDFKFSSLSDVLAAVETIQVDCRSFPFSWDTVFLLNLLPTRLNKVAEKNL